MMADGDLPMTSVLVTDRFPLSVSGLFSLNQVLLHRDPLSS